MKRILVTGGAGYVGSVLVPKLLKRGYSVSVLDLYLFGEESLNAVRGSRGLIEIKGDIRAEDVLKKALDGIDAVIHLACISNDPSYELDPKLGKSINYNAFLSLLRIAMEKRVKRFIYASSSSVYGLKEEKDVTEELSLHPLTDYSKYKAECEKVLMNTEEGDIVWTIIRPATICGYSPRMRLDLTVNILTNHAVNKGEINVFGGEQMRPNIHIDDITDLYVGLLERPADLINRKVYNAGYENHKIIDIANIVKSVVGDHIPIKRVATDDNRSYHISSEKIHRELGFLPKYSIKKAVMDLTEAFRSGLLPDPLENIKYYNIKTMKAKRLDSI